MLGWNQGELAEAASVARQTVVDFERGARTPYLANLSAIRSALEAAGVDFIEENGGGPGIRLMQPFPVFRDSGEPSVLFTLSAEDADTAFLVSEEAIRALGGSAPGASAKRCFDLHRRRLVEIAIRLREDLPPAPDARPRVNGKSQIRITSQDLAAS